MNRSEKNQLNKFLKKLRSYEQSKEEATFLLTGTSYDLFESHPYAPQLIELRKRLEYLPQVAEEENFNDNQLQALGIFLGTSNRDLADDNVIYQSKYPEQTWPGNSEIWEVIHNVVPVQGDVPQDTYWHEIDATVSTGGTLVYAKALSVNKNLNFLMPGFLHAFIRKFHR